MNYKTSDRLGCYSLNRCTYKLCWPLAGKWILLSPSLLHCLCLVTQWSCNLPPRVVSGTAAESKAAGLWSMNSSPSSHCFVTGVVNLAVQSLRKCILLKLNSGRLVKHKILPKQCSDYHSSSATGNTERFQARKVKEIFETLLKPRQVGMTAGTNSKGMENVHIF